MLNDKECEEIYLKWIEHLISGKQMVITPHYDRVLVYQAFNDNFPCNETIKNLNVIAILVTAASYIHHDVIRKVWWRFENATLHWLPRDRGLFSQSLSRTWIPVTKRLLALNWNTKNFNKGFCSIILTLDHCALIIKLFFDCIKKWKILLTAWSLTSAFIWKRKRNNSRVCVNSM